MLGAVPRSPNVFEVAIGQRLERLFRSETNGVLELQHVSSRLFLTLKRRHEVDPIDWCRTFHSRQSKQRRHEIFETNRLVRLHSRFELQLRRTCDDQRNISRPFVGLAFPKIAMVTQHLPMISSEHNDPGASRFAAALLEL